MFPYFHSFSYSESTGKMALGTGEVNEYDGFTDEGCLLKYAFNGPVAHQGLRGKGPWPSITEESAYRRRIQGEYGWIGNLGHDLFEDSLLAHADWMKHRVGTPTQEDLLRVMWERYDHDWRKSFKYDMLTYVNDLKAKSSTDPLPIWLNGHASKILQGKCIEKSEDQRSYDRFKNILGVSADFIAENLTTMIEDTPYDKWHIIEGKKLIDGDVEVIGHNSQADARAEFARPSFDVVVDDVKVRVFCTIDFAYWIGDSLTIADLKTGKVKESHFDQTGLYGYYITDTNPDISPEQIRFRLMYPAAADYQEKRFTAEWLEDTKVRTQDRIRGILSRFTPLNSERMLTKEGFDGLMKLFPEKDALSIWSLAHYKITKSWPEQFPKGVEYSDKPPATIKEVADFLIQKLSPEELGKGLISHSDEALEFVEFAVEQTHKRLGKFPSYEDINRRMLRTLVSSGDIQELVDRFSVSHLRIALPGDFMPTGATNTPAWCRNCVFFTICEPGKYAANEIYRSDKK